jgi:hypothetical protein
LPLRRQNSEAVTWHALFFFSFSLGIKQTTLQWITPYFIFQKRAVPYPGHPNAQHLASPGYGTALLSEAREIPEQRLYH